MDVVYLDFQNAFDKVHRQIVLFKVKAHNMVYVMV